MSNGRLYGIGVGPGDSELLTLKAVRIIRECDIIFAPRKSEDDESVALKIVEGAVDLKDKNILRPIFAMSKATESFWEYGRRASDEIIKMLKDGKDVVFVTLGDVSIYSTFFYMQTYIKQKGYDVIVVPGISSFSAGAAQAGIPLVLGMENLVILPSIGDKDRLYDAIGSFDNIVIMKSGRNVPLIAGIMGENHIPLDRATVISNVGMDGEYIGPLDTEREYGYFTTVIINKVSEEQP